jgi:hypothetical protein
MSREKKKHVKVDASDVVIQIMAGEIATHPYPKSSEPAAEGGIKGFASSVGIPTMPRTIVISMTFFEQLVPDSFSPEFDCLVQILCVDGAAFRDTQRHLRSRRIVMFTRYLLILM